MIDDWVDEPQYNAKTPQGKDAAVLDLFGTQAQPSDAPLNTTKPVVFSDEPSDWVDEHPAVAQAIQQNMPQKDQGFLDRLSADFQKRGENFATAENMYSNGGISSLPQATLKGTAQVLGSLGDIVSEGAKSAMDMLPQYSKDFVAQNPLVQAGRAGIRQVANSAPVRAGIQAASDLAGQYPQTADALKDAGTIALNAPLVQPALSGTKTIGEGLGALADRTGLASQAGFAVKKAAPSVNLPAEYKGLEPLIDATKKNTVFSKAPNAIKTGLEANKQISIEYDSAKKSTDSLYNDARKIGNTFDIKAPDLYSKLENITKFLDGKVALGSKEQAALSKLADIKDNLKSKFGIASKDEVTSSLVDSSGNPYVASPAKIGVRAYAISPNDLIEIKQAINSGLSGTRFLKAGDARLVEFKNYVNRALSEASAANPEFGKALKKAEVSWGDLNRRFISNKPLNKFWTPEDHLAWQTSATDATKPAFTDATLTRASTFLDNLNTNQAGRIASVVGALPSNASKKVLRAALIKARKETPSIGKAAFEAITGRPIQAGKTLLSSAVSRESPMVDLANSLRKLSKSQPERRAQ